MKKKTLQHVAAGALALVMTCSALTGCIGTKKPTGTQKPSTSQSEQQKPDQKKSDQKKSGQKNNSGSKKPVQKPGGKKG